MSKKILFIILGVIIIALAGGGYWYFTKLSVPQTQTDVTVQLKWVSQSQFAGLYTAEQKGYYEKQGLNVDFVPYDFTNAPIDEVIAGNADFGITGADELLIAREAGEPIKAVAVIYQKNPVVAYALASSGITEPADFVGQRLGMEKGVNVEFIIKAMLESQNIDYATDITEIPIGFDPQPLIDGEVDIATGYITNEPILAEERGFNINIISPADYGINLYADVIFATEEMIENNPELVQSFVEASLRGWEYALDHEDEAIEYTLEYRDESNPDMNYQHELSLLQASSPLIKPSPGTKIGDMSYINWRESYEILLQNNIVTAELDVSDAYTREFIE